MTNNKPYLFEFEVQMDKVPFSIVNEHPFNLPLIQNLGTIKLGQFTIITGENGVGKSTLIEALSMAIGMGKEGGNKNFSFATADKDQSVLSEYLTLRRTGPKPRDYFFLRAESFYNFASAVDRLGGNAYKPYGGKSLHHYSHGESFIQLLTYRLQGNGLYIFDEPESALSPQNQLTAMVAIDRLLKTGSQIIMATHSPILMSYPGALLYDISEQGVVPTTLEETRHYQIYNLFMRDKNRLLHELFDK